MTGKQVVPVSQIQSRLPVAGRLRFGDKGGRNGAPRALRHWRFTSSDQAALETIAARYGGEVVAWSEPKSAHTHQVSTEASEIEVAMPPNPISISYDMWTGRGRVRSCDGVVCSVPRETKGPDGPEVVEVEQECICMIKGERTCDANIRLEVLLPEIRLSGTWVLHTKSENALHELPAALTLVQLGEAKGLPYATLRIDIRKSGGKTFAVPMLGSSFTPEQLAAGYGRLGQRTASDMPAIERKVEMPAVAHAASVTASASSVGSSHFHTGDVDEIEEAELVDDDEMMVCAVCDGLIVGPALVDDDTGTVMHSRPSDCAGAS